MTSYTILSNNDNGATPHINFGGFLVGNPSTDAYENKYGFVGDIYGHGLLKSTDWYTWYELICFYGETVIYRFEISSSSYPRTRSLSESLSVHRSSL